MLKKRFFGVLPFQAVALVWLCPPAFADMPAKVGEQVAVQLRWGMLLLLLCITALLVLSYFIYILRQEIKERRKAEEALKETSLWLRNMFDSLEEAVFLSTPDRKVVDLNPAAERIFGYTLKELRYGPPELLHVDRYHYQEFNRRISDSFGKGESAVFEFQAKRKSGQIFPTEHNVSMLTLDNGKPLGIVSVLRDISEQKKNEESLHQARMDAEKASRAKSEFLANMSHEIRTPLNAIVGMAELLKETKIDNEQREFLEVLDSSSELLLTIINDIIDLSKVEAGKIQLEESPFSPDSLVSEVCRQMTVPARTKGLIIDYEQDPGLPPVLLGDQGRLRQILLNLINNAIKFTHQGSVQVRCELAQVHMEEPERQPLRTELVFAVSDTGCGIPPDKLKIIFERFTQLDSSTTREFGGTGLGLTICKKLVELMGGRIGVESTEGGGSTFWFTACLDNPEEPFIKPTHVIDPESVDGEVLEAEESSDRRLHSEVKVLLAEDYEPNRKIIDRFLRNTRYRIEVAENGYIAVEKFIGGNFDLVLMDMQMPVMDGFTATRKMREFELASGREPAPIIALTAYALQEDQKRCLDAGCNIHLSKPIKRVRLLELLAMYSPRQGAQIQNEAEALPPLPRTDDLLLDHALADLVDEYIRDLRKDIHAMHQALAREDFPFIKMQGHRIAGSGGGYGLHHISELGRQLEEKASEEDGDGLNIVLQELLSALPKGNESDQQEGY